MPKATKVSAIQEDSSDAASTNNNETPRPKTANVEPATQTAESLPMLFVWEKLLLMAVFVGCLWYTFVLFDDTGNSPTQMKSPNTNSYKFPPTHQVSSIADARHYASIEFHFRDDANRTTTVQHGAMVHAWRRQGTAPEGSHTPHGSLYSHIVFGITSWKPEYLSQVTDGLTNEQANQQMEREILDSLHPAQISYCHFYNQESNWRADGRCVFFALDDPRASQLDRQITLVARRYHQPTVYKWWPHQWGQGPEHVTLMQSVLPVHPSMEELKRHGPLVTSNVPFQ